MTPANQHGEDIERRRPLDHALDVDILAKPQGFDEVPHPVEVTMADVAEEPIVKIDLRQGVDKEIIRLIRAAGEDSRVAREFAGELREAGVGSILKLYADRMLFRRLAVLRIYVPPAPAGFHEEIGSLAYLSAYGAVPNFVRDFVFGPAWDSGRASLKTCLVNACLCQFGREYRRFCTQERHDTTLTSTGQMEELEPGLGNAYTRRPPRGPEAAILERESIGDLLAAKIRPVDKIMLIREAQGFTQKEIAEELNMTESAVNSSLRRSKKKIAESTREDG